MTSSQTFSPQENGVTTGTGHQFGPAPENKHYEMSQWQMTTIPHASVKEVLEHPRASKRRKISGEPSFLRGGTASGYLGPVLTIYHAIPLAREALLFPQLEVHAYGHDPNWWSGASDENYKSASVTNGSLLPDLNNYLCEIQTLMGFLDSTQRAYGSVDSLADLNAYKYFNGTNDFDKLLAIWERATMAHSPEERLTQVYTSVAMKDTNQPNVAPITKPFQCLDPPVQAISGAERTLYGVLDGAIWGDEASDTLDDVWLHHCAPILTLRLFDQHSQNTRQGANSSGLGVRIPAILYADRYIEENREESWKIRSQAKDFYRKVQHLSIQQERLRRAHLARNNAAEGQQVEISQVLQAARDSIEIAKQGPAFLVNGAHSDDLEVQPLLDDGGGTSLTLAQLQQCANELESIMEAIERKLSRLEEEKNKIREEFRKLSLWMTTPLADSSKSPHKKYYLSGVTTKPWITYVRVKQEKDLIEFEEQQDVMTTEADQTEAGTKNEAVTGDDANWQWWRVSFSRDEASQSNEPISFHPPLIGPTTQQEAYAADQARKVGPSQQGDAVGYSVKKIREDEVLKAAREESTQVIAVYASEEAIHFKGSELSESLQAFVERDNKSFELDLRKERRTQIEEESITTAPDSSTETGHHVASQDDQNAFDKIFFSPDTSYAADQSSSPPTQQPPVTSPNTLRSDLSPTSTIQGDNTTLGREMTPMSVSSPKRENENEEDLDLQQGSPKRPRSSDSPRADDELVDLHPVTTTDDNDRIMLPSRAQLPGGHEAEVDTPTVGPSSSDSDLDSDLDVSGAHTQMEERKIPRKAVPGGNKIGLAAERMMEKYGHGDDAAAAENESKASADDADGKAGLEIEHPHEPLR